VDFRKELLTEYRDGQRVFENQGLRVIKLVRGTAHSYAKSSS
jgi:hypothetical protein